MSEAEEAQEQEESQLEGLGVRTMDEIVLPGDEGPAPEAEEEAPQGPTEITAEPAEEAPAVEDEAEEAPTSTIEAVRQKLREQAGTAEATPQDAKDLELAQLRQQSMLREQDEKRQLQERLQALEQRIAAPADPAPSADDGHEMRLAAAAKFYEEKYELEPDQAKEMAASTAEHARIEAELRLKEGLAPIEEKWAEAEKYQTQQAEIQQSSSELAKGVIDLAKAGGTELELAQDFQQNGFKSFLGAALAKSVGNDPKRLTEVLSREGSAILVEQAGAALARRMEAVAAGSGEVAQPATAQVGSTGLGAKTSPRSRGATKPTPKASNEEKVAAELDQELGGAEEAFSFLRDDFKWDSP